MALTRYLLAYAIRSYRLLPPLLAYVGVLLFLYSEIPNPVMDSYAFTGMWLFVVSGWLSYVLNDTEHELQRCVTLLRARSAEAYEYARLALGGGAVALLSLLAVVYPIVFGKFDRTPGWDEAALAFLVHVEQGMLGIVCALFFASRWMPSRSLAMLGLLLTLAVSLAGKGVESKLPEVLRLLMWAVPPSFRLSELLVNDGALSMGKGALILGVSTFYIAAVAIGHAKLSARRLF